MLAFDPEADWSINNKEIMDKALTKVKSGKVGKAIRVARCDKLVVEKGEFVGIWDNEIRVKGETPEITALELIKLMRGNGGLLSIYYSKDVKKERGEELTRMVL